MKKILFLSLALFLLSACNQSKKSLVVYFSATGTTAQMATSLAQAADADLYEIVPEVPYTEKHLNWRDSLSRTTFEMQHPELRPRIVGQPENFEQYKVVYLGFPIWWGVAPNIIHEFILTNDLKGKTIIPFATSGSSGIEKAEDALKEAYPDLDWKAGKRVNDMTLDDLKAWVKSLHK